MLVDRLFQVGLAVLGLGLMWMLYVDDDSTRDRLKAWAAGEGSGLRIVAGFVGTVLLIVVVAFGFGLLWGTS